MNKPNSREDYYFDCGKCGKRYAIKYSGQSGSADYGMLCVYCAAYIDQQYKDKFKPKR